MTANTKAIGVAFSDPANSGGSLDGAPVGATTPSTGAFTTLTASGLVGFHGVAATAAAAFAATLTAGTTAADIVTYVNKLQAALIACGLMAAS